MYNGMLMVHAFGDLKLKERQHPRLALAWEWKIKTSWIKEPYSNFYFLKTIILLLVN